MSEIQVSAKKAAQFLVQKMVQREMTKWPPDCLGTFFQPKRPEQKAAPVKKR